MTIMEKIEEALIERCKYNPDFKPKFVVMGFSQIAELIHFFFVENREMIAVGPKEFSTDIFNDVLEGNINFQTSMGSMAVLSVFRESILEIV